MSLLKFFRGIRTEDKPNSASIDDQLLLSIEQRLSQRTETLVEKALVVRERLSELLENIESPDETLVRPAIGGEGDDIDFLLADILTLRSLLSDMKQQMHMAERVQDVEPGLEAAGHLRLVED